MWGDSQLPSHVHVVWYQYKWLTFICSQKKKKEISHKTYPDPYFSSENECYPISPYSFFKSGFTSNTKAFHRFLNTIQASGFSVYFVFVLSYQFPFYICRSRFLLGNMGIMNNILSPSSVLCSSFYPSLCSLTAYSPTRVRDKNSLCPVCSFPISQCFPILWVLFCSPGKEKNVFLPLSPLS